MQAIRRFSTRSCLIVALVGPLLGLSETADGLARSLAELSARGVIEPIESATCDGSGVAGASMKAEAHPGPFIDRDATTGIDGLAPVAIPVPRVPSNFAPRRGPGSARWFASSVASRLAWLQFLLC